MNAVVELPKDYLKKNPKAKPENYPQETGCGVLQLGKTSSDKVKHRQAKE